MKKNNININKISKEIHEHIDAVRKILIRDFVHNKKLREKDNLSAWRQVMELNGWQGYLGMLIGAIVDDDYDYLDDYYKNYNARNRYYFKKGRLLGENLPPIRIK